MRKCRKCDEVKPIESFYYRRDSGKRRSECVSCTRKRGADYAARNPEKVRLAQAAKHRKRRAADPDYQRRRYLKDVAKSRANGRAAYKRHRAKRLAGARAWAAANPGRARHYKEMHRQAKLKQCPSWADIAKIRSVYEEAARLGLTVDHIYPLRGRTVSGLHVENNLRLISHAENCAKGNKHPDDLGLTW